MRKYIRHIILSITLLLGLGLSLSTVHFHGQLTWDSHNDSMQVEHSLTANSSLCPICAYLVSSDGITSFSIERAEISISIVPDYESVQHVTDTFTHRHSRAPPFFG